MDGWVPVLGMGVAIIVTAFIMVDIVIFLHEGAHAATLLLFGNQIADIRIGCPKVVSFHFAGTHFSFGPVPMCGHVRSRYDLDRMAWWKIICVSAAGPLATLTVGLTTLLYVLITSWYGLFENYPTPQNVVLLTFSGINLLSALNLFPVGNTDGGKILRALKNRSTRTIG